jgi:hypothetical protein
LLEKGQMPREAYFFPQMFNFWNPLCYNYFCIFGARFLFGHENCPSQLRKFLIYRTFLIDVKNYNTRNWICAAKGEQMSKNARNWILGGIGLALLVLGVPLVEQVLANANAPATVGKPAAGATQEEKSTMGHPSVLQLGENYLQIIPTGNGAIGAVLYDSSFTVLGTNQNEAALTFTLPDGSKKTINIAVPDQAALTASSSGSGCCATSGTSPMPESCPRIKEAPAQKEAPAPITN